MKMLLSVIFLFLASCGGTGGGSGGTSSGGSGGTTSGGSGGTTFTPALYVYELNTNYISISATGKINPSGVQTGSQTGPQTQDYPYGIVSGTIGAAHYLYVANRNSNSVSEYSASGGTISIIGTLSLSHQPISGSMVFDASRLLLFVAYSGGIAVIPVLSDGTLGTPAYHADPNAYTAWALSEDATKTYLVAADQTTTTSWAAQIWTIGSGGALTAGNLSAQVQELPQSLVADPVTTNGNYLYAYTALLSISGGTVTATDMSAYSGTCAPGCNVNPAWIDPTGTWLYVIVSDGNSGSIYTKVLQYEIASDGTLSPVGSGTVTLSSSQFYGGNPTVDYMSANGILVVNDEYLWTLSYNSLNGNLTLLNGGDMFSIQTAYLP